MKALNFTQFKCVFSNKLKVLIFVGILKFCDVYFFEIILKISSVSGDLSFANCKTCLDPVYDRNDGAHYWLFLGSENFNLIKHS